MITQPRRLVQAVERVTVQFRGNRGKTDLSPLDRAGRGFYYSYLWRHTRQLNINGWDLNARHDNIHLRNFYARNNNAPASLGFGSWRSKWKIALFWSHRDCKPVLVANYCKSDISLIFAIDGARYVAGAS